MSDLRERLLEWINRRTKEAAKYGLPPLSSMRAVVELHSDHLSSFATPYCGYVYQRGCELQRAEDAALFALSSAEKAQPKKRVRK